ncbi:MAG TPA: serine/threonine-protein kinase [Solirubrobacterales bacterium]|nr:serine/threonine-protein kinase [Solirubrobacterales bacterium]
MGDLAIGSTVAGYRIDGLIARGGMGVVYRATHLSLERPVALKVIAGELAGREGFRERFLRESRLAARLDHPAVVPVYDAREADGELIVAMRLVEGGDLRRLLDREGPLEPARAIALLGQVAEALDAAHAAGIVHRDVKPHNVLVEGDRAYLSDFGLAKALGESGAQQSGASVVGTAEYMSPEQWRGGAVGPAADVYSLGCVLYEALTGIPPFARKEADSEPELPEGLGAVIERAAAKDPDERYPSAGVLIEAAREREGAGMAATRVLSESSEHPTSAFVLSGDISPKGRTRSGGGKGFDLGRLQGRRGLQWIGAGVALCAGLAVLAVTLLGGDGVDVSDPVPAGAAPLRITASGAGVWVSSERDGTLRRLDPESGEEVGRPLPVPGVSGVAVGGKWLWATVPRRGELLRIDKGSGRVLEAIDVGGAPGPIALGGGRVWVADEEGRGVTAVNSEGGRIYRRGLAPHAAPLRLAVGAGGLWVSSATAGNVRRIDLGNLEVGEPIAVGRGPAGVTVARGLVWVANSRSDTVSRVDPSIHAVLRDPIEVGGRPGGIDAGDSAVWVASASEDAVTRIDLASGEREGDPVGVGPEPGAVAIGAGAVWVVNNGDGTVTRIEP